MIEIFVLIGWIDGHRNGGVIGQEFNSLETCNAAKAIYVENLDLENDGWSKSVFSGSWMECVRK